MPLIRRTVGFKMNLDADERLLPEGETRKRLNVRSGNSEGSDVGAIEKSLSNKIVSTVSIGSNVKLIGSCADEFKEKIYTLLKSDNGCYVVEYDVTTETTVLVAQDTRLGVLNALNFNENKLITGINLVIDSDNNNRLLLFTDNNTQPKNVNIERAKTYAINGFTEEEILVIKKPPIYSPTIVLGNTPDEENNIKEKFISFSYRYKYLDGGYSALGPFSEYAFKPKTYEYDYSTGINEGMVNTFNKVSVTINTGSKLVTDVEIVFKESGSNALYLIESFNKAKKVWTDNTTQSFDFTNNKIYKVLAEKELFRLYDNVPLLAKGQDVIQNQLVYGNYTENYNIADCLGDAIKIDLSLEKISTAITVGVATESLKSNRSLEICPAYIDDYGRMTTPLSSENNTIYIPNSDSIKKNQIKITLLHKAPCFAKYYRFFIKQTKGNYETIAPTLFYEDGGYRWVKLEGADKDKIKEGDYLIIKSDSQGVLSNLVKVKVLEVKEQEKNFLQPADVIDSIKERSGLYFKIKPKNFRLNIDDFENFEISTYHNSRQRYHNCLTSSSEKVGTAYYYGDTLDDLTSGGVCTLTQMTDKRFLIKIDGLGDNITTYNTFKWSIDDGANWVAELIVITAGAPQNLSDGVTITFTSNYGHSLVDEWNIYARGTLKSDNDRAYGFFRTNGDKYVTMTQSEHTIEDEIIENGANISIIYDEYNRGDVYFELDLISTGKYANIQEWYYKENIGAKILLEVPAFDLSRIYFMRGILKKDNDGNANYLDYNADGYMTMVMESQNGQYTPSNLMIGAFWPTAFLTKQIKLRATTTLFQSDGDTRLIFETNPQDFNSDIYYEIGRTYAIDANQNHLGFDGNDISQAAGVDAKLLLPTFNCYSWGNAHESYKIKDEFNAKTLNLDTRPSTTIENYRQNKRIASLTYSQPYEQSTNYNGLNEFNLSLINFLDLDDKYGAIQKIVSWNTDLDVWQEDKVHKVLYKKAVIYNKDGTSNLAKSDLTLDGVIAYSGEYGISEDPEGLVIYGNYAYWPDSKRGVVLRKGQSGIEIISNFGMRDWFRDSFRNNTSKILGGYDPYFGQYIINLNGETLTFDEKVKGWTSFHSYIPDAIIRINNRLFTVKNGNLWLHNEELNGYNEFYGSQYKSTVEIIFNDAHNEDKIFKTIIEESTNPWKVLVSTNLANSTIEKVEFNQRESRWFSYIRQNENETDLNGVAQGIGNITAINGLIISFTKISNITSIGDKLYQLNGTTQELIGLIVDSDFVNNTLTIDTFITSPTIGLFSFSKKNSRVEGAEIRGYVMNVILEDDSNVANELFAVSSNVVKSYL